jgi:hypothetical protein
MQPGGEVLTRPAQLALHQRPMGARPYFRLRLRQGRRHLVFLPGTVLKLALNPSERHLLRAESRATTAAARHPFWRQLAVRAYYFAGVGVATWRFRPVQLADFDAVAATVEDRLEASRGFAARPMQRDMAARPVLGLLDAADRHRLDALIEGCELPESSMHGDLHFYNFVGADDGYRLIDWEHYDARGSFVFDYIDFHVAVDHDNARRPWTATLGDVGSEHRAVRKVSRLFGLAPRALAAYYRLIKIDTIMARRGGARRVPQDERAGYRAGLRRLLASATAAAGSSAETAGHYAMLCCAV